MGLNKNRGHIDTLSGSYEPIPSTRVESIQRDPRERGLVDHTSEEGSFNKPNNPTIREIDYVPYGNVYERPDEYVAAEPVPSTIESSLYPVYWAEPMTINPSLTEGLIYGYDVGQISVASSITEGTLRSVLQTYEDWPEELMTHGAEITVGTLRVLLIVYDLWPIEEVTIDAQITSGTLENHLITYSNWIPEGVQYTTCEITGGTLV